MILRMLKLEREVVPNVRRMGSLRESLLPERRKSKLQVKVKSSQAKF